MCLQPLTPCCERLVDQDIDLVFQSRDRTFLMRGIRRGDDDRIRFFFFQHLFQVSIKDRNVQFFRRESASYFIDVADCTDGAVPTACQMFSKTGYSAAACTDNGDIQFFLHNTPPLVIYLFVTLKYFCWYVVQPDET